MTRSIPTGRDELPSLRQLNRATLTAFVAAGVILVTTVLPAEYGIDPTGTGRLLGLTAMGEAKQADHARPAMPAAAPAPAIKPGEPVEVKLTLAPGQGREVKATMKADGEFDYRWATDGAEVRFELHGEPADAVGDEYTSYEKGSSAGASGKFRAPFDGTHGWYWKNRGDKPVTITVTAKGDFDKFAPLP